MSKSVNKVILIGHLGQKPEMKYTAKGTAYSQFSLATNSNYKDANNNNVEKTEWHTIVAWTKLAEICTKYLDKGSLIYCEGRLQTSTYEKEGTKQYFTKIVMENMTMLDSKKTGDAPATTDYSSAPEESQTVSEDLPF
ncbi:MAG TPA: single-stranded DNA-binding protein [Ignavibacteria bacterium]|nr:single-stranded DNA-binding protein [Ignavibacteria bacterium]